RRRFLSPTAKCIRQNAKRPHPLSPSLHPVLFSLFSQSLTFFFSVFSTFPFLPIYVFSFSLLLSLSHSLSLFLSYIFILYFVFFFFSHGCVHPVVLGCGCYIIRSRDPQ